MEDAVLDPPVDQDRRITDAMGPNPIGYIAYHADGRMMAFVERRDRVAPHGAALLEQKAALFDSMLAYTASYKIKGDTVIHTVDGSWNPAWARRLLFAHSRSMETISSSAGHLEGIP
jgi:hypothetical protein